MNKKDLFTILLDLVFLLVFNIVFFMLGGTDHSAAVWISYGFIHFAYIMVVATPLLIRKSSASSVFGMTIASVSSVYFVVELVIGLVLILINVGSVKGSLLIHIIITGVYLVALLTNLIANEDTANHLQTQENEVAFIKGMSSRVNLLKDRLGDKYANKVIEQVYDLIHSSPSKSCSAAQPYEYDIYNKIGALEQAVKAGNNDESVKIAGEIIVAMEERNRVVKMNRN